MSVVRKQILTTVAPETVWEAWTRPERLEEWLSDYACGQATEGNRLNLRWKRFNSAIDLQVVEAVPGRRLELRELSQPDACGSLTVSLAPRGTGTLVRVVEQSSGAAEQENSWETEWELSLTVLKLYLENYYGRTRTGFLALLPVSADPRRLALLFGNSKALAWWFSREGTLGRPGEHYRLLLADGSVASGRVLAHTRRGLTLEWSEIGGYLQFNALPLPSGLNAFCIRGGGWGLDPERAAEIEKLLEQTLSRLSTRLTECAQKGQWPLAPRPTAGELLSSLMAWMRRARGYLSTIGQVAQEERLSALRLVLEHGFLYLAHGVDSQAYFTYRLFDPELPLAEKFTYLDSDDSPRSTARSEIHTPPWLSGLYKDKVAFKFIFGADFPVPRIRALISDREDYLEHMQQLRHQTLQLLARRGLDHGYLEPMECLRDEADLDRWMRTTELTEFAIKPVFGIRGVMTRIFSGRTPGQEASFVTLRGEAYDARALSAFSRGNAFFVEERIRMHPALEALLGPTLCCVRVVTTVSLEGRASILGAVFKLQAGTVGVDHLAHGAVGAWVDLESGYLGPGRTRSDRAWVSCLPGTEVRFVGFRLPLWQEVKRLALTAAASQPQAHSIGWDIAISPQGPVLIEGNPNWSPELVQMPAPYGLMRGEFRKMCQALERLHEETQTQSDTPPSD